MPHWSDTDGAAVVCGGSRAVTETSCRGANVQDGSGMRTKLSTCRRKKRFASSDEARTETARSGLPLLPYVCDRCGRWHLTSRTKGKRLPGGGLVGD